MKENKINYIVGEDVDKSLSPFIHNFLYKSYNIANVYCNLSLKDDYSLADFCDYAKDESDYFSVTNPYKVDVIKYLDEVNDIAKEIGGCNMVVNRDKKLIGYNTDYDGIIGAVDRFENKISKLSRENALIIGCGGASRAVIYACKLLGFENIYLLNRTVDTAEMFAKFFNVKVFNNEDNFDLIINTAQLRDDDFYKSLLPKINKSACVFDINYQPIETQLIKYAKSLGCNIIYGLDMLIFQAIKQFEVCYEIKVDEEKIDELFLLLYQEANKKTRFYDNLSKICVTIIAKDVDDLLNLVSEVSQYCHNIEIRFDCLEIMPNFDEIEEIFFKIRSNFFGNIIFTLRKKEHGGEFDDISDEYWSIVNLSKKYFNYLDIDVSDSIAVGYIANNFSKIIASYHNFEKCLNLSELQKIFYENRNTADIVKFACKVENKNESDLLLDFLKYCREKRKQVIVIGMGDAGKSGRVSGVSQNYFTFASPNSMINGFGQLTFNDLISHLER